MKVAAIAARVRWSLAAASLLVGLSAAGDELTAGDFADALEAYDAGDYGSALALWRLLADTGNAEAQSALGALYLVGEGVPADPVRAARWFRLAAEQGHALAQLNLGDLYAHGRGVERNLVKAYVWLSRSAAQGSFWAWRRRQEITRSMTAGERREAEHRIAGG